MLYTIVIDFNCIIFISIYTLYMFVDTQVT